MGIQARQREAEKGLHDQMNILPTSKLLIVLSSLSITLLITFIDQNGIGVTLPTIAADLGAENSISWAGTTSLIANTMFQVLYGRLSDIFGRKSVFLGAVSCLCLAALLCGLSHSPAMFYVFRGLAGIGGGGIQNLSMIIVSDVVTLEQRGKYQGVIGSMVGLGNVAGPFLAGAFIERTGSWRAFFYMVAPLAACVGVIAYLMLPSKPPTAGFKEGVKKIDFVGVALVWIAVIFLLIPISGGGAYFPWDSAMVISMLVIGGTALIAFVVVEWKVARLPIMPVQIFHNPCVTTLLIQSFLLGLVYQSFLYYLPLYLQNARGFNVIQSAGFLSIAVALQAIISILSGQYISRTGRYGEVIWFGFASWTLGTGLQLIYTRTTAPGIIAIPLIFNGIGVGMIFQPTLVALQAHIPRDRRAVIISNRNFFRCGGGAVGLAVSAAVLQAALRSNLPAGFETLADNTYAIPSAAKLDEYIHSSAQLVAMYGSDIEGAKELVLDAYMAASRAVFIMQTPAMGLCLLGCFLVKDRGLEQPEDKDKADGGHDNGQSGTTTLRNSHGGDGQDANLADIETGSTEARRPEACGEDGEKGHKTAMNGGEKAESKV